MIIVQVEGGLGNQMFQYALALSFIHKGVPARLDISKFTTQHSHNGYELERIFNIAERYSTQTERAIIKLFSKLRHKILDTPYKEKPLWQWHYHAPVNALINGYLKGYWQCEKYFRDADLLVKKKFTFPPLQSEQNRKVLEKINSSNSVSLHIRRGDYLHTHISASLDKNYYLSAIEYIKLQIDKPYFFVFSDDINWAREHIQEAQMEFIYWNKNDKSYIDMQLMSQCRHNIIANSSFSWWGAWLNSNADKIVVAPQQWMPHLKNGSDVIPSEWITLPNYF